MQHTYAVPLRAPVTSVQLRCGQGTFGSSGPPGSGGGRSGPPQPAGGAGLFGWRGAFRRLRPQGWWPRLLRRPSARTAEPAAARTGGSTSAASANSAASARSSSRASGRVSTRASSRASGESSGAAAPRPTLADLYHARRLELVRLAVLLVDDRHTAEDVVQDAFAALCRRYGTSLEGLDDAGAYLHTAVVNSARSVLRRRRTARAHTPPHETHAAPVDERLLLAEEHREVLRALARLTRRQREVLVLRYWSELSEAQIAETLGLSRGTVKSTASRALDSLEKLLEADT